MNQTQHLSLRAFLLSPQNTAGWTIRTSDSSTQVGFQQQFLLQTYTVQHVKRHFSLSAVFVVFLSRWHCVERLGSPFMPFTIVTLLTVWSIIPAAFIDDLLWRKSLLFELLCPQPHKKRILVYLHFFSALAPAFSVNKVYSLFRRAAETCVSVSILIQSISMGSMSYSVRRRSLCARRLPEYLQTAFVPYLFETLRSIAICESVPASRRMHVCVCRRVREWGTVFPGLLVIMFLGVMGGNLKALCCPNQN